MVVVGVALLTSAPGRLAGVWPSVVAALLSLPALCVARWPYQTAFLAIVAGGVLRACPLAAAGIQNLVAWLRHRGDRASAASVERAAPRWLAAGLGRLATALTIAGCVLGAQALALVGYEVHTSRSHELPAWLAHFVGWVAGALGIEVGVYGSDAAVFSYFHPPSLLGATWELLLDPATWAFLSGGMVWVLWRLSRAGSCEEPAADASTAAAAPERFFPSLRRVVVGLVCFLVPILLWLPLRTALLLAIYLHDVVWMELGEDWMEPAMLAMRVFWSTPIHLALLMGPILLAWRLTPRRRPAAAAERPPEISPGRASARRLVEKSPSWSPVRSAGAGLLAFAGVGCLGAGVLWTPVGHPKQGRILIEENRWEGQSIWDRTRDDKRWERTRIDKVYDTTWYGELSGYNYNCITRYASQFFRSVSALQGPIDDKALSGCDVFVLKVPGRPFSKGEIDAVERFVRNGGGLLVIADHTNVYGHASYLNAVTQRFGFRVRHDCLLGVDLPWQDLYEPPLVPHPIVQHLGEMNFATSCSIAPGASRGRAAIRWVGLKNLPPNYFAFNLQPGPEDRPEMRYGAFVQLWTTRFGRGRVAAFTDSTIFSNFCVFEPGKKELFMGMLQWLNHEGPWLDPTYLLAGLGLAILAGAAWIGWPWDRSWLLLVGCGALGWTLAVWGVRAVQESAMPRLKPAPDAHVAPEVVMDQTVCSKRLPTNGTVDLRDDSFGIFERWILRLGCFTARLDESDTPDEFRGDVLVFLRPDLPVSDEFRQRVVEYVEQGGKVLVVDAPDREKPGGAAEARESRGRGLSERELARRTLAAETGSQVNRLLEPFGLVVAEDSASSRLTCSLLNLAMKPFGVSIDDMTPVSGPLRSLKGWPSVQVAGALGVQGGKPFAWIDRRPVGATLPWGEKGGSVTVIGFGSRLKDGQMGGTDFVDPDKLPPEQGRELKDVYQWHFGLFRAIVDGTLLTPPAASGEKSEK